MIKLTSITKRYTQDQDKTISPTETVSRVRNKLAEISTDILSQTKRIDTGRLDIPVFLSMCGTDAQEFMPTRKQMGKGASMEQAEASALMELIERYSYWVYWDNKPNMFRCTWQEAKERFGDTLISIEEITHSVGETISPAKAEQLMNLLPWWFTVATDITNQRETVIPLDWFRKLGEFNGSSAGNCPEESIFQGACELIERHVCCKVDRDTPTLPTIDPASFSDPVLQELYDKFTRNNIQLIIKDFSMEMPVPTIAVVAWDPETFPEHSEIVYTAGTASSPAKAAIRALTEVAQLAGDFMSDSCYEASGLPKYTSLADCEWLQKGPVVSLDTLPSCQNEDIYKELIATTNRLSDAGYTLYSVETTNPELGIPAHYNIIPGFQFRERDKNATLGLFIGRILSEEHDAEEAMQGLKALEAIYGDAHFIPFFKAMLALRSEDYNEANALFLAAEPLQPENDSKGLAAFYGAYSLTLSDEWENALPGLSRAVALSPDMKEYLNLRGVCYFKLQKYAEAAQDFETLINVLDKGSAIDLANLGLCYKHLGKNEEAIEYFTAALAIDSTINFAREHLAELAA